MIKRPGFLKLCNSWKNRNKHPRLLVDIYDGTIWKKFNTVDGRSFLKDPNNLALMMNVDWFQPYKRSPYSIGVIYFAILNLPRHLRFKPENVIAYSFIPGPNEPKGVMNSYLKILVEELKQLWQGVYLSCTGVFTQVRICAAVVLVACDTPATRKVLGFTSHNSIKGCSKCLISMRNARSQEHMTKGNDFENEGSSDESNEDESDAMFSNEYCQKILILAPGRSEIIVNIKRLRIYTNNAKQNRRKRK